MIRWLKCLLSGTRAYERGYVAGRDAAEALYNPPCLSIREQQELAEVGRWFLVVNGIVLPALPPVDYL